MRIPDLSFVYTFSSLTIILNAFYYNERINNALYLSNILSLIGFCVILFFYPKFYYDKYNSLIHFNLLWFNITCILIHILPVVLFIDKNNIDRNNLLTVLIDTVCILLLYLLLFYSILHEIYPFSILQLFIMCIVLLPIISGIYYILL
jgi:hypothetical protein